MRALSGTLLIVLAATKLVCAESGAQLLPYHVTNNAALKAVPVPPPAHQRSIIRDGFLSAGDGGYARYIYTSAACTNPDSGAQVAPDPAAGTGCWLAEFSSIRPTPKIWGAKGDGVTDDTTKVAAALAAMPQSALWIGAGARYLITAPLNPGTASRTVLISDEGPISPYATSCPSGLIADSDIDLLTLTGPTATVQNVCFQMARAAGTRTGGYALKVGATAGTQQGHARLVGNTVIFPYDGILVGGATTGTTQTNSSLVADNLVISPKNDGIAIGRESSEGSTAGTTLRDNQVVCYSANNAATGIAHYDGAVRYYGADTGPYLCNIGFAIKPGRANGARQTVVGSYDGVLGDSSLTVDLDIDATHASAVAYYLKFVNAWAAGVSPTDTPVRIRNTGNGMVKQILFSGGHYHSGGPNATAPIFDLQAGENITITGNSIAVDGGGTLTGPAIKVASTVRYLTVTGNTIGSFNGSLATGIQLPSPGVGQGIWTITGNTIAATTPISYTPNRETAVIRDNVGVDNVCPAVADAASISFPNAASCVTLDGRTTVTSITNSAWSQRGIDVFASNPAGKTIKGGGAPLCGAANLTLAHNRSARLWWNEATGCWGYYN